MGSSRHCTRINRRLLPVKSHYFLFMAALACALPFRTIFAKQLGFSATAVGVIFCIIPFLKTVTNPLFGFVLDYFKKFRLTLSVIITFVALSHVAMILIPSRVAATNNLTNFTDFHLKMRYSCAKDVPSHDCDHSLMLYSKYTLRNEFQVDKSSFICDVLCSNDFSNISDSNKAVDMNQCHERIRFNIRVRIEISKCDMNVSLNGGEMFIISEDVQDPTTATLNVSTVSRFKTWRIPVSNCSERENNHTDSSPEKSENKNLTESDMLEDGYSSTSKRYLFTTLPDLISVEDGEGLYAEQMFSIKVLGDKSFVNSSCRSSFICKTKKCNLDIQTGDFESENEFLSVQFWGFFLLMSVSSVMLSAVIFLMDAVCYELLQENKNDYGRQRLWGTIGWGIGALVGGYINQIVSEESEETDYAPSFCLLALLSLIDLIPMYNLKVTELKYSSHIWKDVCFLFTKINIVYNAIVVYSIGALSGFIWNYQFWFMEEIGSSQILLGLSQTLECIFELPWFVISGWIIKKFGHDHCNNITLLCFGLRYLCFVVMYNPWWTLAAGLFHGPTFGLFYASMTMYAKNKAPPGTEATVQSILHFFFEGIGIATGSFLGGVGLDRFGSRMSFLYAAVISFILLFINLLMGFLFSRTYRISKKTSEISCCS